MITVQASTSNLQHTVLFKSLLLQDEGGSPLSNTIDVEIFLDRPPAGAPVFSASVYIGSISERYIPVQTYYIQM